MPAIFIFTFKLLLNLCLLMISQWQFKGLTRRLRISKLQTSSQVKQDHEDPIGSLHRGHSIRTCLAIYKWFFSDQIARETTFRDRPRTKPSAWILLCVLGHSQCSVGALALSTGDHQGHRVQHCESSISQWSRGSTPVVTSFEQNISVNLGRWSTRQIFSNMTQQRELIYIYSIIVKKYQQII